MALLCIVFSPAHTPDNSFLGFVAEEAVRKEMREEELEPDAHRKNNIAVVYGKQDYMWQVMRLYGRIPIVWMILWI